MKKKIIITGVIIILGVLVYLALPFFIQPSTVDKEAVREQINSLVESNPIPSFTQVPLDFVHTYDERFYASNGSAVIDIDGDGVDELYIGGGEGQADGLFKFENGAFVNINNTAKLTNNKATGGAVSIDIDNDGDEDMYVARFDGVYQYINNNGVFTESVLDLEFEQYSTPFSITVGDINKDSLPDLYVSTFKDPAVFKVTNFNDPGNRDPNKMFLNKGNGVFEDITVSSGLEYSQNTFEAVFVDLDNDTYQDLVVAPNTGRAMIFKNNGDETFENVGHVTEYGFWMGLAIGDIDNDGDQDLFFSNIGITVPPNAARGDMTTDQILDPDWALIQNNGDFTFTNITEEKGVSGYEFSWGAIFEDLNANGATDLVVIENYIKWPAHKIKKLNGRVLLQTDNGTFIPIEEEAGLTNPFYGTSPVSADFNGDGYPDVAFINFSGPSHVFLNDGGVNNHFTVQIPQSAATLGTRVDVERTDGVTLSKQVSTGIGFMADNGSKLLFGLGQADVEEVRITWPDGGTERERNVDSNTTIVFDSK